MHDRTKPLSEILASYPRGNRELRGTYTSRFTPDDAYEWFVSRGVMLKTESDGRMFPITDDSSTIVVQEGHEFSLEDMYKRSFEYKPKEEASVPSYSNPAGIAARPYAVDDTVEL